MENTNMVNGNNAMVIEATENQEITTPVEPTTPALFDVTTLIVPGRKGITNFQMLTSFKAIFTSGDHVEEKLTVLYHHRPDVFKSAAKYMPDANKVTLEKLVQTITGEAFQLPIGKKVRLALTNPEASQAPQETTPVEEAVEPTTETTEATQETVETTAEVTEASPVVAETTTEEVANEEVKEEAGE